MRKKLNVLLVEDSYDDLELLLRMLQRAGYDPNYKCVDSAEKLTEALTYETWDIVLTDCHLPQFSGARAIGLIRETLGLDLPIIVVSGAIGEETAVRLIKAGAQDYVLKDKLARLPVAIEREIRAAETRRAKKESEAQMVLERANFISIVAHDLRAPIQRIETMVQLLRSDYEDKFDEDGKDIVFRVERSAARLRLMLASLLAYSRYGRDATNGKVASLKSTIDEVLENVGIDRTTADLEVELGSVDWIKGDSVLIGHVILNLVSNALKFRRKDVRFGISFKAQHIGNGNIQVSVTDNGIGIEPRFADKVFDIFYRLHDEDEYEGTGIGLAICKKIITDHGGTIWVDKNYSDGASINFTLNSIDEKRQSA
ncbi:MAG: response regulator [Rhodopseudomonas sp.]|nr:response regulator [Rhodopseudomonas sp.]